MNITDERHKTCRNSNLTQIKFINERKFMHHEIMKSLQFNFVLYFYITNYKQFISFFIKCISLK